MGCGNSSPTTTSASTNNNTSSSSSSSSKAGCAESSTKVTNDSSEDDKRKNYGGVYVGLPTDLSNIPQVQIGALREIERDPSSLRKPLWGGADQ